MSEKILVVGCGSIGRRHLRNLKILGVEQLLAFDPAPENLAIARQETDAQIFESFETALAQKPDVCFVCSPSSLHVEHALEAARDNCHLFVEKPLSHDLDGVEDLVSEIERRKLISLVGCNMRFHPGPARVKKLLLENAVGKVVFAQIYAGSYLPEWRPATNYRESYSGRRDLGGGAILDCIHEIDLAFWYAGAAVEVFGTAETLSLPIETEDTAFLLLRHQNGVRSEIHLDYVQRTYERGCRIVGEAGTIFWDFREKAVRLYRAADKTWETFAQAEDWEINQMYLDETRHFLDCLQTGEETICPVRQAAEVLKIALAAKTSAQTRGFVEL
jgi:predicted dehydrogenase